jgi:hypothetical protein
VLFEMNKNILAVVLISIIIFFLIVVFFAGTRSKDIDVNVLEIHDQNNQYYVNVSLKNNQEKTGWIEDTYLSTVQGSKIDLTGAGSGHKIESGKTIILTLWSAEVQESITESPFTLTYTAFPSGNEYTVYI